MKISAKAWTGACLTALCGALLPLIAGCAAPGGKYASSPASYNMSAKEASPSVMPAGGGSAADGVTRAAAMESQAASPPPGLPRKIIYSADIILIVKDLSKAEAGLKVLLKRHGGFVSSSDLSGTPGYPRSGNWTVRVPVERFEDFKAGAVALGEIQNSRTDSQDVTEEFYDVAARLKNKKVEEQRLLRHLDRSTARLEDILAVEREISRVRGEIEQMEGRIRLLSNQTELTTITLHLNEVQGYIPTERTTFLSRVARTFSGSVDKMTQFFATLALVFVALTPWFALMSLVGVPLWVWVRRRHRR
jgi:hypothetical protein